MNYSRESLARLRSGCCTTTAIIISFGTGVPGDLTNVSVNDYFRLVVWLFGFVFLPAASGLRSMHCLHFQAV